MPYDPACETLAKFFLSHTDIPACMTPKLAQEIQDTIEKFIAGENQRSSTD